MPNIVHLFSFWEERYIDFDIAKLFSTLRRESISLNIDEIDRQMCLISRLIELNSDPPLNSYEDSQNLFDAIRPYINSIEGHASYNEISETISQFLRDKYYCYRNTLKMADLALNNLSSIFIKCCEDNKKNDMINFFRVLTSGESINFKLNYRRKFLDVMSEVLEFIKDYYGINIMDSGV